MLSHVEWLVMFNKSSSEIQPTLHLIKLIGSNGGAPTFLFIDKFCCLWFFMNWTTRCLLFQVSSPRVTTHKLWPGLFYRLPLHIAQKLSITVASISIFWIYSIQQPSIMDLIWFIDALMPTKRRFSHVICLMMLELLCNSNIEWNHFNAIWHCS